MPSAILTFEAREKGVVQGCSSLASLNPNPNSKPRCQRGVEAPGERTRQWTAQWIQSAVCPYPASERFDVFGCSARPQCSRCPTRPKCPTGKRFCGVRPVKFEDSAIPIQRCFLALELRKLNLKQILVHRCRCHGCKAKANKLRETWCKTWAERLA